MLTILKPSNKKHFTMDNCVKFMITPCLCFLHQGVLRDEDLELFDEDFRKSYKQRQVDLFDDDKW